MANQYFFKTTAGSSLIPIANGTHYTELMSGDYADCRVYLRFLAADGVTPIVPTGGTVTFSGSPDIDSQPTGAQYLAAVNAVVTATTVEATAPSTYTPPTMTGRVVKGKMIVADILGAGATYVQAFCYRY